MHKVITGPADLCLCSQVSCSDFPRTNLIEARRSQSSLTVPQDLQIFWQIQIDANTVCVSDSLPAQEGEFQHALAAVAPAPSTTPAEN